jgi:hypothetical protein
MLVLKRSIFARERGEGRRKLLQSNISISSTHVPFFSCLFHSLHYFKIWPFSGPALVTLLLVSTDCLWAPVQAYIWTGFDTHDSRFLQLAGCLLILLSELEDEGRLLFWNLSYHLLHFMASHPRRHFSSFSSVSVRSTKIHFRVLWFWTCQHSVHSSVCIYSEINE